MLIPALFASCSSSRYLGADEYVLAKNEIKITEKNAAVTKSAIQPYISQRENARSLFGIKFKLGLYNAAPCDSCWLGRTLRGFGEPPVIFDPLAVENSTENMAQYLRSLGYYHALVNNTVAYNKHKAKVTYTITPKAPFTLQAIDYRLHDSVLAPFILSDTSNSLIKQGMPLSLQLLEQERERIELFMHNRGFFSFNRTLISYRADTLIGNNNANLTILLNTSESNVADSIGYSRRYRIRHVQIYTEYDAVEAKTAPGYMESYSEQLASSYGDKGDIRIRYRGKQSLRTSTLLYANTIIPGAYYSGEEITQTYNNLSNLRLFRVITVGFDKVPHSESDTLVDCTIRLTPNDAQGFKFQTEVSLSSSGLLGISPAVNYYHRNIFHGAEWLSLNAFWNYQFDPFHIDDHSRRANELGLSATIGLPKFFFPYINNRFKTYSPRTEFTIAYNYQFRPEYTRNSLSFLLGYSWRPKQQLSYTVNILNLNIVKLFNLSSDFYNSVVKDPYLRNRYENHFILGTNASLVYSTRQPANPGNSIYLRWTVGAAGNILSAFNGLLETNSNGNHLIWSTPYAQYAKTDVNISYYQVFNKKNMLAYRFFLGIGRAYGNSISLPYEEVYFSGGAYSLRGWQSRTVGPGAAPIDSTFSIPNQVGDFKLEANIEYRFNISGIFDGALFADAGNVWSLNYKEADKLAVLKGTDFFKQIALNTGFGLRLNFDIFVIRFDVGAKLHEPRLYEGWIPARRIFSFRNMTLHFGIGYAF